MVLVYGCTYEENCACDPCCCNTTPNCDSSKGDDLKFFEDSGCCYGPWDTYIKKKGAWVLEHTIYCLSDVYDYYHGGPGGMTDEYVVVLSGRPITWDSVEDPETPECWFDLDPYKPS